MRLSPISIKTTPTTEILTFANGWVVERTPTRVRFNHPNKRGYIELGPCNFSVVGFEFNQDLFHRNGDAIMYNGIGPYSATGSGSENKQHRLVDAPRQFDLILKVMVL